MRAHATAGNTAEALLAYEQCRVLIAKELGVPPCRETKEIHATIIHAL